MELLVHVSTSGHLLVAEWLEIILVGLGSMQDSSVHVITAMCMAHLLSWATTISVRVFCLIMTIKVSCIQMLHSGMARCVRVVAHVASSTILHGSQRT